MQLPLQISFQQMERLPEVEAAIRERAARLDKFARRIMSCRAVITPMGKHHKRGNQYKIRLDIKVPTGEIVSTREPSKHTEYKELSVAIRDAFASAERQLKEYVRVQRGAVKSHHPMPHARVSRMLPDKDCGFLRTPEEREIYFHRNSVLNADFDVLTVGIEVAYVEEEGRRGPQASTVRLVGLHGGA